MNADVVDYDEYTLGKDIKRLRGNVQFSHENALLSCDSAIFNTKLNNVYAYSNVEINQGDTVQLFGDSIRYFGNTKIAEVRSRVNLVHGKANLTTDSLNYDRNTNIAYYFNWGTIRDKENTLVSEWGYYYATPKDFIAINKVILTNPRYRMISDTLKYNVDNETAFFNGPTTITSDSNLIYCENGWYNTQTEQSRYSKNAYLKSKSQTLRGDSLFYDRNKGHGVSWGNVEIKDTVEHMMLNGQYGEYFEEPEKAMMTDSALYRNVDGVDTLYMHADTLRMLTLGDTANPYKFIMGWYHVRTYRYDMQSDCDSLTYSLQDSVMRMFIHPVIWFEKHQLTAENIVLFTKNNKPHMIDLLNSSFIISDEDSLRYNQLKGKNMRGFFEGNQLRKVEIKGNSQSIYYAKEDSTVIGVNQAECSNMDIYMIENEIEEIVFHTKPDATMYTPKEKSPIEMRLKNFMWYDYLRPKSNLDIFRRAATL
ncbi:MAG: organic solvent tolerance protein OstA [Bacteroidetes bacterium HGW-Bacteroidetes-21]|nr:MAG: organic solvent tolerance protein OstA [Bacteroidetes bacterium HGW-Bacteroidetes-21]